MSGLGESSGPSGVGAGPGGGLRRKGMSEEYFGSAADWEEQDGSTVRIKPRISLRLGREWRH